MQKKQSIQMIAEYQGDIKKLFDSNVEGDMPVLITRNVVLFPGVITPVVIGRKKSVMLIKKAEKNPDMARQFGIMQAPTLVITDGEHLKKYVNASNIQKYVDEELD